MIKGGQGRDWFDIIYNDRDLMHSSLYLPKTHPIQQDYTILTGLAHFIMWNFVSYSLLTLDIGWAASQSLVGHGTKGYTAIEAWISSAFSASKRVVSKTSRFWML
jgi:hypothetical protein